MKIAFFVHCFFPDHFYGTETYTYELAKNYASWGHDVTVFSAVFQGEAEREALISSYYYEGIKVVVVDKNKIPHQRIKETFYQPEMRDVLKELLIGERPDVIHVTHLINHTAALLEVASSLKIPTYTTFTDFFGFCLNNKLEAAGGELCSGPSETRTNCVACYIKDASRNLSTGWMSYAKNGFTAKLIASSVMAIRKIPPLKGGEIDGTLEDIASRPDTLQYLYNSTYKGAVAPTAFLQGAYQANNITVPMRKLWFGIDIDRSAKPRRSDEHIPNIGFIGQIAPHKGTDLLIEAFRKLPAGSSRLQVYGPLDQDPLYAKMLKDLAHGQDVTFMGTFKKESMSDVLRGMDLLVIPSRWYENSPLVLLSALATHTPVLVSDVLGMTEFLIPGENGYSFKRGDKDDLYKKLLAIVERPDQLYEMSRKTNYERTPEIMARETFVMYELE